MRARLALPAIIAFALAAGCGAGRTPMLTAGGGGTPGWVPAYNADQQALLAPAPRSVRVRASRVFPDLERFQYADDMSLTDPREAIRVTQLVAESVEHSPHDYELAKAGPELANSVVQYGPSDGVEPDPWKNAFVDHDGKAHVAALPMPDGTKSLFERGVRAADQGDDAAAEKSFRAAIDGAPDALAPRLALARLLGKRSPEDAEAELRRALRVDPTLATTHHDLAEIFLARGDVEGARREIAHALAYAPTSKEAFELASRIPRPDAAEGASNLARIPRYAIFLDVDARGAIRMAAAPTASARMYAGCRAVMRFEPEVRVEVFGVTRDEPYFLSAEEEMLCLEAGIGAMLVDRQTSASGGAAPEHDEQGEALLVLAHTEGLLGYAMFEIIGQSRPDVARMAPPSVHKAIVAYVDRHVLGWNPDASNDGFLAFDR